MKRFKVIILIAFILIDISLLIPYDIVDPQIKPYETEYLNTVKKYCKDDQYYGHPLQKYIGIEDLQNPTQIAYCSYSPLGNKFTLIFNKKYWDVEPNNLKKVTLWHEFFHCYFHELHSDDQANFMYAYETYVPVDVMEQQAIELLKKRCSQ